MRHVIDRAVAVTAPGAEVVASSGHVRAGRMAGTIRRLRVVASEEYRRSLESRWLFGFSVVLTALIVGLSFFALAQSREVGFQGFVRVTLSLMTWCCSWFRFWD